MKDVNLRSMTALTMGLVTVALCLQLPQPAKAEIVARLTSETASLDLPGTYATNSSTVSAEPEKLYGSVKRRQTLPDESGTPADSLKDSVDANSDTQLQSEKPSEAAAEAFALSVKKLSSGLEMTSDDYRSLGVGCVGYEADRTFFQKIGKVTKVYRGSPAAEAGIHAGDKIYSDDSDEEAIAHPDIPLWQVSVDQAGTQQTTTLIRNGQPVKVTLTRMNIEDIQEDKIRRMWEKVIRNPGFPKSGTFTGRSLKDLRFSPEVSTGG